MNSILTLDRLRRIQQTLQRRARQRDAKRIRAVGFAPRRVAPAGELPVVAQFDVRDSKPKPAGKSLVEPQESVRLLDRSTRRYQELSVATDVWEVGEAVPTGVVVRSGASRATTSLIVRWTTLAPPPAIPTEASPQTGWRWGVLTVAHVFRGASGQAAVDRLSVCGEGPQHVPGRVVARGRIPGGPDVAVIETGLDRLWLSGFLDRVEQQPIVPASVDDLLRWTSRGTTGNLITAETELAWRWKTYFPEFHVPQLGKLAHVIRYQTVSPDEDPATGERAEEAAAAGPGSSGAVLLAGGAPLGLQIAAVEPDYQIGYAQSFEASLPWLKARLRASEFHLVRVITGAGAEPTEGINELSPDVESGLSSNLE